jgi:hypothetical protein
VNRTPGLVIAAITAVVAIRPAAASTVTYAIVIGNNAPPSDGSAGPAGSARPLHPLRYADDDAVRYYQLFSAIGQARLLAVLDTPTQRRYPELARIAEPPTLASLRSIVASYAAAMTADRQRGDSPVLYFAFSGHGARDRTGAAFLALLDGPLTQSVLYDEVLARLPAVYSHVLIDACHAGGVVGVRGDLFDREVSAQTAPVTDDDVLPLIADERSARLPQVGIIVATSPGQEAHEWSEIEAGVFSHEILSGLVGPADVNGDGAIEYTEIQAFVAAANRDVKDPRAMVRVIARPPRANQSVALIALSQIRNARVLAGEFAGLGHFYIELDNGQRYLDAHLATDMTAAIVVPANRDVYLRTETGEVRLPAAPRIALGELRWSRRSLEPRGSIDGSYRTALFSSEYGRDYYRGYVDSIGGLTVHFPSPGAPAARAAPTATRGERGLAIAMAALAGVALAGSVTATALAIGARQDFAATDLQRPAQDARDRYERDRAVAIAAGSVALAAGAAAFWLWPRAHTVIAPTISAQGGHGVSVETRW